MAEIMLFSRCSTMQLMEDVISLYLCRLVFRMHRVGPSAVIHSLLLLDDRVCAARIRVMKFYAKTG